MFKYKGRKNKGGKIDFTKAQEHLESTIGLEKLYSSVLADFALTLLNEHLEEQDKQVMFINDLRFTNYKEQNNSFLQVILYLWPEMTFDGEIDYTVVRKVPRDFDAAFAQQCKNLTFKHRIAKDVAEGAEPEFIYLDVDDEKLYIAEGFESKEAFKKTFDTQWNNYMDNSDKHFAFEAIFDKIVDNAKFDVIPQPWITTNTNAFQNRHLQSMGNDKKKAMSAIGVKTEEEMRHKFEAEVYRQTIHQMGLNWFAKKFNVANTEEAVCSALVKKVAWV